MKKLIIVMAACLFIIGTVSCGQNAVDDTELVKENYFTEPVYQWGKSTGEKLVIWGIYPDMERSYINKAFDRYRELTGNQLEIVQIPKNEFENQVLKGIEGEVEMADILVSYGGTNVERFRPDENFYDFTDAEWVEDLTDTSINQTIYNGKVIGLPHWEASISGTLYNKKLFEKYQIQMPKTQDEFMEVCQVLKDNGVTPLYLPGKEVSMLLYQFALDSVVEDNEILTGLNDASLDYEDLPEMKQAIEWYKTMAEKGYLGSSYETDDWNGMNDAMKSEEYAMMLCWDTWLYTDFRGDPSQFGLMPAFIGAPKEGTFEGPNLELFMVNKHSKRLDAALNFITFLADPYNYNEAFQGIYTAPVFKNQMASISTPQYLESEQLIEEKYRDSIAWLRLRGFSQMDASCILKYMDGEIVSPQECLKEMDKLRKERVKK